MSRWPPLGCLGVLLVAGRARADGPRPEPEPDPEPMTVIPLVKPELQSAPPPARAMSWPNAPPRVSRWGANLELGAQLGRIYAVSIVGGSLTAGVAYRGRGLAVFAGASIADGVRPSGLPVVRLHWLVGGIDARLGPIGLGGGFQVGEVILSTVTSDSPAADPTVGLFVRAVVDVVRFDSTGGGGPGLRAVYLGTRMELDCAFSLGILSPSEAAAIWGPTAFVGARF